MIDKLSKLLSAAGFAAIIFTFAPTANAQYRGADQITVSKTVRFRRGEDSAVIRGKIARGAVHQYRLRAGAGQEMTVVLRTGNQTSFTIYNLRDGILEGADGVKETTVELPANGEYVIEIGTDAAANYTLEITIR